MMTYLRHSAVRKYSGLILCFWAWLISGSITEASVRVEIQPDGTRKIVNENEAQRARRSSSQLVNVPQKGEIARLIRQHARHQGLNPRLVQAVVQVESGYNPKALSSKGAMGLMQLMPDTAAELGVKNPYDPDENIRGGVRYLKQQLRRFSGDLGLALAAYNAGPGAVQRHGAIPPYPETQRYVEKVYTLYQGIVPSAIRERARDVARMRSRKESLRKINASKDRARKISLSRGTGDRILFSNVVPQKSSSRAGAGNR